MDHQMSDQTPTPRTDETWEDSKAKCLKWSTTAFIMRECSAKLERELAAAIAERDQLRERVERVDSAFRRLLHLYEQGFDQSIPYVIAHARPDWVKEALAETEPKVEGSK